MRRTTAGRRNGTGADRSRRGQLRVLPAQVRQHRVRRVHPGLALDLTLTGDPGEQLLVHAERQLGALVLVRGRLARDNQPHGPTSSLGCGPVRGRRAPAKEGAAAPFSQARPTLINSTGRPGCPGRPAGLRPCRRARPFDLGLRSDKAPGCLGPICPGPLRPGRGGRPAIYGRIRAGQSSPKKAPPCHPCLTRCDTHNIENLPRQLKRVGFLARVAQHD